MCNENETKLAFELDWAPILLRKIQNQSKTRSLKNPKK